jgi:hypothetical protein
MRLRVSRARDDDEVARLRARYLDLLKSALTHTLYRPMDVRFENAGYVGTETNEMRASVEAEFAKPDFDWADVRRDGRDWPRFAQTMVGVSASTTCSGVSSKCSPTVCTATSSRPACGAAAS